MSMPQSITLWQATTTATVPAVKAKAHSTTPVPVEAEFEFSDTTAITCLLCARQFKTLDQLKRHNKESDLHKVSLTVRLCVERRSRLHRKTSKMPTYAKSRVKRSKRQRRKQSNPSIATEPPSGASCTTSPKFRSPRAAALKRPRRSATPKVHRLHRRLPRLQSIPGRTRTMSATGCCG